MYTGRAGNGHVPISVCCHFFFIAQTKEEQEQEEETTEPIQGSASDGLLPCCLCGCDQEKEHTKQTPAKPYRSNTNKRFVVAGIDSKNCGTTCSRRTNQKRTKQRCIGIHGPRATATYTAAPPCTATATNATANSQRIAVLGQLSSIFSLSFPSRHGNQQCSLFGTPTSFEAIEQQCIPTASILQKQAQQKPTRQHQQEKIKKKNRA